MQQSTKKQYKKTTSPHGIQGQRTQVSTGQSYSMNKTSMSKITGQKQQTTSTTVIATSDAKNQQIVTQTLKQGNNSVLDLQEQEAPQIQVDHEQSSTQFQSKVRFSEDVDHSNNYMAKLSTDKTQIRDVKRSSPNNHFQYSSTENQKQHLANNKASIDPSQKTIIESPNKDAGIELKDEITPIDPIGLGDGPGTISPQQDSVSQTSRTDDQQNLVRGTTDDQDRQLLTEKLEKTAHHRQQEEFAETIVDPKYGDQKIDISDIQHTLHAAADNSLIIQQLNQSQLEDPTRPTHIQITKGDANQPLPSYSNKVNIGEFSVGNFKEFQLREDLSKLIEKYNKQFYGDAKKPAIPGQTHHQTEKESKYKEKMIINPIAVPQPGSSSDNFSWMCLVTPYHNQLVKEFNTHQMENHILKQHFEYYLEMDKEKELLTQEFQILRSEERKLLEQLEIEDLENQNLEQKVEYMDKNLHIVHPERFLEKNEKVESLSNQIKSKDTVIDKLLNEIALIKNEKDDLQNDVLFKKQRIENLNFEFNTKELEYQRLWEEEQSLKDEVRGDTSYAKDTQRENEMLQREIAMIRDEIAENQAIYEQRQLSIQEQRMKLQDYEERLRYGNEVIMSLEAEGQQTSLDIAQQKAYIEGQSKAYSEILHNYNMISSNNFQTDGSIQMSASNPIISIPKVINPSTYFRPSAISVNKSISLMPSPGKALTQYAAPSNIKSYLSIKKTVIDLTSDLGKEQKSAPRDQKVRFSMTNSQFNATGDNDRYGDDSESQRNMDQRYSTRQRRSDSVDARLDKRNFRGLLNDSSNSYAGGNIMNNQQSIAPPDPTFLRTQNFTRSQLGEGQRVNSVNRNFVDTMSGILGVSEDRQQLLNSRASAQQANVFPLKKVDISTVGSNYGSPQKSILKDSFSSPTNQRAENNNRYRDLPTDVSTDNDGGNNYTRNTMNGSRFDTDDYNRISTQTPNRSKALTSRIQNSRYSQAQQQNNAKQQQPQQQSEQKFRQATWQERMQNLPRNSAYKSSITFGEDGVTANVEAPNNRNIPNNNYQPQQQPFKMAREYDIDVSVMTEDDPQAKTQVIKFKQQKIYDLTDQRKLLQSQISHIPENSKQMAQRNKRQEIDSEIQKITKRISVLKYDVKKLTCKDDE